MILAFAWLLTADLTLTRITSKTNLRLKTKPLFGVAEVYVRFCILTTLCILLHPFIENLQYFGNLITAACRHLLTWMVSTQPDLVANHKVELLRLLSAHDYFYLLCYDKLTKK